MNISPLQSMAAAASKLLSAVTTQIGEFAESGKLRAQSLLPATAFLLGCLAISMSLLEPARPREWWANLSYDVKVLLLAFSGVLLILLSELGIRTGILLRQFYSGEWPAGLWSLFRIRYLEQHLAHKKELDTLNRAHSQFRAAEKKIHSFSARFAGQVNRTKYPVLRVQVNPYQLIGPEIVELQDVDEQNMQDAIRSVGDLIGRYATKALEAGRPVAKGHVRPAPKMEFFEGRKVISLEIAEPGTILPVTAGSVVSIIVRGLTSRRAHDDIFVLDRPNTNSIVLSVQEASVISLLNDLNVPHTYNATLSLSPALSVDLRQIPGGQEMLEFIVTPTPESDYLLGIPVARIPLLPGQIIRQDEHIQWAIRKSQSVKESETKVENIVGAVYWPRLENGKKSETPLDPGSPFVKTSLHKVKDKDWLTYIDSDRKSKDRVFDKVLIETEIPIHQGDRLKIFGENNTTLDRFCYVIHLQEEATSSQNKKYTCYVAVSRPLDSRKRYHATPYDEIPVLKAEKPPGTLLNTADIEMKEFRADDPELFQGIYTRAEELRNSYTVLSDKMLSARKPVPRGQVLPAVKHEKQLSCESGDCTFEIYAPAMGGKNSSLRRGDLVSVGLVGKVQWDGALVCEVESSKGKIFKCVLTIPAELYSQAENALNEARTSTPRKPLCCRITITHNDAYFMEQLKRYRKLIRPKGALRAINKLISGKAREHDWIHQKTEGVCGVVDDMQALFTRFSARPWRSTPENEDYIPVSYDKALRDYIWQHGDTIKLWRESIMNLIESRLRGRQLTLPDRLPETRATTLGNVLAAAADYPRSAYNIDTATLLPRLVLALGDEHKAVQRLNTANDALFMLLLFSFWAAVWTLIGIAAYLISYVYGIYGPWWFWPIIVLGGPLLAYLAKEAAIAQAYSYGEAIKVLFDTERFTLFTSMGIVIDEKGQISSEREHRYWKEFFQLYAFGNTDGFPPVKLPTPGTSNSPDPKGKG